MSHRRLVAIPILVLLVMSAAADAQDTYAPEGPDRVFLAGMLGVANMNPAAHTHFLEGVQLLLDGNQNRAQKAFEAGLTARANDYYCLHGIAQIAFARGGWEKARAAYQSVIATYPEDYFSWYKLGTIAILAGDFTAAEENLSKALAINGKGTESLLQLGTLYAIRGDSAARAITSLRRAFPAYDENPELNYELGQLYYQRKEYKEAAFFFDRAIKLGIKGAAQRTALAKALYYQGKGDDADNILRRVIKEDPKNVEAHYWLGAVLLAQKKYTRAADEFERVERLHKGYADARFYLAQTQYEQGLYPQCMANLLEYRVQKLLAGEVARPESLKLMIDIESRNGITRLPSQIPDGAAGMAAVPGGLLRYGWDGRNETPSISLQVKPFRIDAQEVSCAEYAIFVRAANWPVPKGQGAAKQAWDAEKKVPAAGSEDLPVVFVGWQDALAYAAWAGKRLPSEMEWEWAARGGHEGRAYPLGNNSPGSGQARYASQEGPRPVTEGDPNEYGLRNIIGNVAEWCFDVWDEDLRTALVKRAQPADKSAKRAYRGGHWRSGAGEVKVTSRGGLTPGSKTPYVGFRCAMDELNPK